MLLDQIRNWETWDPFIEMNPMQRDMRDLFSDFHVGVNKREYPYLNIWGDKNGLFITSELPGVKPENLEIVASGETLTITGSKKSSESVEDQSYIKRELSFGEFSRSVKLPYRIDPENVEAKLKNGVLTVSLSRPEKEKPKYIPVNNN